ncbi:MAG: glutathione transferase GstA [Venatoribacter sp.]
MKLFYSPGACSLAVRIVLNEAGLPFESIAASTKTHQLDDGSDYYQINPKGYVPYLVLDNGEGLSEGPVICQYIADQVPEKNLIPACGTMERYRVQEWQNFIGTELHKTFGPLFNPAFPEAARAINIERIKQRFAIVNERLEGKEYLTGSQFTVADAYLFVVTNWAGFMKIDLSGLNNLNAFMSRVAVRPAVAQSLKEEGF